MEFEPCEESRIDSNPTRQMPVRDSAGERF